MKIDKIKILKIANRAADLWKKYYNFIFVLSMFCSMCLGIYYWYYGLYIPIMSEQDKNNFRIIKDKSIIISEDDFNQAVSDIENRKEQYSKQYIPKKDVFK